MAVQWDGIEFSVTTSAPPADLHIGNLFAYMSDKTANAKPNLRISILRMMGRRFGPVGGLTALQQNCRLFGPCRSHLSKEM